MAKWNKFYWVILGWEVTSVFIHFSIHKILDQVVRAFSRNIVNIIPALS